MAAATPVAVATPVIALEVAALPPVSIAGISGWVMRGDSCFFGICVKPQGGGPSWYVMHRFSEFLQLRDKLRDTSSFPRKHYFGCTGGKLEARRCGLEVWLQEVVRQQRSRGVLCEPLLDFLVFTMHPGFIKTGGNLHKEVMTVEQAKRKCMELPGCKGFTYQGGQTNTLVIVWFKDHWGAVVDEDDPWTSCRIEAPLCSTTGCTRAPWSGKPGDSCCRSCRQSRGNQHGHECTNKFGLKVPVPVLIAPPLPSSVSLCAMGGCIRPVAMGCSTCCGSCGDSNGKQHDLQCQTEKDGRDAAGLEASADQLVKVARDKSADIAKIAPAAADIDRYIEPGSIWQILERRPPE